MTGPKNKDKAEDSGKPKLHDPTKEGPFKVDPESSDFALPRNDLSEEELKEQEDRRR